LCDPLSTALSIFFFYQRLQLGAFDNIAFFHLPLLTGTNPLKDHFICISCLWRHYKQVQQNPTIAQSIDAPGCYFSLLSKVLLPSRFFNCGHTFTTN
jgi:hypothetical protein